MSRRSSPPGAPNIDTQEALDILNEYLKKGRAVEASGVAKAEYSAWVSETRHWVEQSFGENSARANEFSMAGQPGAMITAGMDEAHFAARRREALGSKLRKLETLVNILERTRAMKRPQPTEEGKTPRPASRRRVFVVHGRDEGAKEALSRYLDAHGFEAVVLHEQVSGGRTIIEKLEAHADVAFAVVLLTPDDRGGEAGVPYEKQMLRARQNVVLELGYFIGRLGRQRVCALHKDDLEIPTDLLGVIFVRMDKGGVWQQTLTKELSASISSINLDKQ